MKFWDRLCGRLNLEPDAAADGAAAGRLDPARRELVASLSPREYDLFLLLLEGYTLKESAARLSIGYCTANTHMTAIYRKLRVKSRAGLIIGFRFAAGSGGDSP